MGITHLSGLDVAGVPTMGMAGLPLTTGSVYWVAPASGSDGNEGTADSPFATLYRGYAACTAGKNDVVVLVGDGAATGTARLSLALAQTITPAATTGTLTWAKNATHLIGMTAPTMIAQRARIAPPSGTYTQATFNSGNLIVLSASGCIFQNFSIFHGFSTGGVDQIALTVSGSRNYVNNVHVGGMGDAASAADTGSRSLKVGSAGSGENTFDNCVIGLDTVDRSVANASLELAGATPRNVFKKCLFPMRATNAGVLSILCTGNGSIDRFNYFDQSWFINAMDSGATAQTVIASCTTASPGGSLIMDNCGFIGDSSTNWGDANAMANMYVMGATPTAASNGNAVNPT